MGLFAFKFGPMEIMVLLVLFLLLFGRKLPETGRFLGQAIMEFHQRNLRKEDEEVQADESSPEEPLSLWQRNSALIVILLMGAFFFGLILWRRNSPEE